MQQKLTGIIPDPAQLCCCFLVIIYFFTKVFLHEIEATKLERQNDTRIKPSSSTDASYEGPKYGEIWQIAKYVKIAKLQKITYSYENFCIGPQENHLPVYTERHLNY